MPRPAALACLGLITVGLPSLACGGLFSSTPQATPVPVPVPVHDPAAINAMTDAESQEEPDLEPVPEGEILRPVDTRLPRNSAAFFPLTEDLELVYDEILTRGAGDRVLFQTNRPKSTTTRGTWRFRVVSVDRTQDPPRYEATLTVPGDPKAGMEEPENGPVELVHRMTLWQDGDRVLVQGPWGQKDAVAPEAGVPIVPSETIRCQHWYLGGLRADCQPVGGTGGTVPGPEVVHLDTQNDAGNAIARTVIGIATLGTVIPGSKRKTRHLVRRSSQGVEPALETPALYQAWVDARPTGDGVQVLDALVREHPPDAASLARIVGSEPAHVVARTELAVSLLPPVQQAPVLRAAFRELPGGTREQARFIAAHQSTLAALPERERSSVYTYTNAQARQAAELLTDGGCPSFGEALAEPHRVTWLDAVRTHMAEDLGSPECDAAAMSLSSMMDEEEVLDLILEAQPEDRFGPRLYQAIDETFADHKKRRLLERHQERAQALPERERQEIVEAFTFDSNKEKARVLLGLVVVEESPAP